MALFGNIVPSLVSPMAEDERRPRARQLWFVCTRLALGAIGLAGVPVLLAVTGGLAPAASAAVVLLVSQALLGLAVARGPRLETLHAVSAAGLCLLLALVAWNEGGLGSPILAGLSYLVLESAVLGGRRLLGITAGLAAATLAGLAAAMAVAVPPGTIGLGGQVAGLLQHAAVLAGSLGLGLFALREISLRFLRERQIAAQERLITEGFGDLVTRHDAQGAVIFAGDSAQSVLMAPATELIGRGLFERLPAADRPAFLGTLSEAVRDRTLASCRVRLRCGPETDDRSREPHYKWFEVRAQGQAGDSGAHGAEVVCVFRDVSAQRLHETALDLARQQAESASEMKSRFLATVSHELRTPLNAIIGFSEMLASEKLVPVDDARRRDYARMINISGQHLLEVVNTLLDISKIDSGTFQLDPEPVCVEDWIRDTVGMMRLKAEEAGVAVHARVEGGLPHLLADRRACKQILINLLSNAVKFTPRGGRVDIDAARQDGHLVVSVADTGIGIAEADLPRIGEPFFQARGSYDRPFEGTGLGFSVVRGLVALHGGSLTIESQVGQGTRVCIRLSLDARVPAGPDLPGLHAPHPGGSGAAVPFPPRAAARSPRASQDNLETTVRKSA